MSEQRSRLGLDANHTFLEKLGLFLSTLLLGPLIGSLLLLGIAQANEPWRSIGNFFCEAFAVFWVCVLIFIWWRPTWFRSLYLWAERKVIVLVNALGIVSIFAALITLVVIGIRAIFSIGGN